MTEANAHSFFSTEGEYTYSDLGKATPTALVASDSAVSVSILLRQSVHVAAAQLIASRISAPDLAFVNADARQVSVAASLGMTTTHIES
jgi:hypothetical protein